MVTADREAIDRRLLLQLRKAEVQHLHAALVSDHHVCGLQVAMGDAPLVCRANCVGQRNRDVQQLFERHALRRDELGQRLPLDQLHRQEQDAVLLLDRIDRDDVGMVQRGDGTGLALEPTAALRIGGQRMRENLQRDFAPQLPIVGEEDLAHAAGTDGADDPVVAERGRQQAPSVPRASAREGSGPRAECGVFQPLSPTRVGTMLGTNSRRKLESHAAMGPEGGSDDPSGDDDPITMCYVDSTFSTSLAAQATDIFTVQYSLSSMLIITPRTGRT